MRFKKADYELELGPEKTIRTRTHLVCATKLTGLLDGGEVGGVHAGQVQGR